VLIFIGSKIFIADALSWEKFPAHISLGVTAALLAGGILYSLYKTGHAGSVLQSSSKD
jgi:tellurite resistance protein TerC